MSSFVRQRAFALLLACMAVPALLWPSLVNHFPLLFPDTLDYLAQGRLALYALLHAGHPPFGGMRSAMYSIAIFPFHLGRTPWPIVLFQAAIVAYTLFLTTRSLAPRRALARTAVLLLGLSACSSLAWYVCLVMPDILGGPLYLALFLLAFARETLSRTEQFVVAAIAVLGATSHSTHLVLALLLCIFITLVKLIPQRTASKHTSEFAFLIPIAAAILLQLAINARLNGHASVNGNRPPYLAARLFADGTAGRFLTDHCPQPQLAAFCAHTRELPADDQEFLWGDSFWTRATPAEQQDLLREELPLVRATLRNDPLRQLIITSRNIAHELTSITLDDFDSNTWMVQNLDRVLPGASARYARTLQSRDAMPWQWPSRLAIAAVLASLLWLLTQLPWALRTRQHRLLALTGIILTAVVANGILTGALSEVDSRYEARIIWLLPALASLFLLRRQAKP